MHEERYRKLGDNFEIHRIAPERPLISFGDDVREGLAAQPKQLSPRWFYDGLGSILFEAICLLPEYYLTRAEAQILETYGREIIETVGTPPRLVELGSGGSTKTWQVIETLLHCRKDLIYVPIDVSETAIEDSSRKLLQGFPGMAVDGCVADYFDALAWLAERDALMEEHPRTLVLFLGSTIGNMVPSERADLLNRVRRLLHEGDGLLLGADLMKDEATLTAAYDDPMGVTASFNLNLLRRMNDELGANFDLRGFVHRAILNHDLGRIEMHLESRRNQNVLFTGLGDWEVPFEAGETVHTESSHKFDLRTLQALAAETGFELRRNWLDDDGRFSENLLIAC